MSLHRSSARLAFAVTTVILAGVTSQLLNAKGVPAAFASPAAPAADADFEAREIHRVHAHFDSVLFELGQRDIASLTPSQQAHRAQILRTLQSYDRAGVFPHNYDFANPTPYFIDRKTGHLCAFAYLLESTGRRDIVDRVGAANNNVWVEQLAADTALAGWFDRNGISLAEGARIQLPYTSPSQERSQQREAKVAYAGVAAFTGALGATVWNATANANGHHRTGQVLGLVAGAASIATGAATASVAGDAPGVRNVSLGVSALGALSVGLSVRSMMHHNLYLAQQEARTDDGKRAAAQATIAPIIPVGKNSGAGLSMQIRF